MSRINLASLIVLVLYAGFVLWYTPLGGPLEADEIDHYVGLFAERGNDAESQRRLRRFLEEDTGDDLVILNFIHLQEPPQQVEGVDPEDSASDVLGKYMEYMWPALLKRACHPVLAGSAASPAVDVWGIEGALEWSQGAAMRYRSRRDLMKISTNPAFQGRHEFKIAAMAKTIAFPIDPWFQLGDPRLVLGMSVAILLLLLRLFSPARRSKLELAGRLR